jgi:hypothetical protein
VVVMKVVVEVLLLVVILASNHVVGHSLRNLIFLAVLNTREVSIIILDWVTNGNVNRRVEFLLKLIIIFTLHEHVNFEEWIFALSFRFLRRFLVGHLCAKGAST